MTDEKADAILVALADLLAEVRALRRDLAPKPTYTPSPGSAWPQPSMYQCATCGVWVTFGMGHSCLGVRWATTTAGTNKA